jgi:hypothetical protein
MDLIWMKLNALSVAVEAQIVPRQAVRVIRCVSTRVTVCSAELDSLVQMVPALMKPAWFLVMQTLYALMVSV